jgi:hypothetical protein
VDNAGCSADVAMDVRESQSNGEARNLFGGLSYEHSEKNLISHVRFFPQFSIMTVVRDLFLRIGGCNEST